MKQIGFLLFIIIFSSKVFCQVYLDPICNSQAEKDLKIWRITCEVNQTTIDFTYTKRSYPESFILLFPPNTHGAYYIKADGKIYKLISTKGISNTDGVTKATINKTIYFSATFEAIPKQITQFDLIEGSSGGWDFFGIRLDNSSNIQPSISSIYAQKIDEECDQINFIPASTKPSCESFLRGVKYAMLAKPSNNQQIPIFDALYKYVDNLGLIKIFPEGGLDKYDIAEIVFIEVTSNQESELDHSYNIIRKCYDIKLYFTSPKFGYEWVFSTTQTTKAKTDQELAAQYYNCLRSAYNYSRGSYNSQYTLKSAKQKTCWTESTIKQSFQTKGVDNIEGIYQASGSDEKYRLALKKIKGIYHLIYISGAFNKNDWDEGEIKAIFELTATPLLFTAKWIMGNKEENNNCYVSFEKVLMNVFIDKTDKSAYIKLYPTSDDKIQTPSAISSSGTGFAVTSNGVIITNNHVIEGAKSIKVRGVKGDFNRTYSAKVIITDKNNDLSILKIEDNSFTNLGVIPFVIKTSVANVGENIFVLGYPLRATMGDEIKLTNGIVSSKSGFQGDITSYQISAPVQPGNSGGPLFDNNGYLIGIINAKNLEAENASYAVKSSYLINLINLLDSPLQLQKVNTIKGKSLSQQVEIVKKFVYIIEIN
ncbi:MAG: trypsin-like peptidase domain-containing protein [Bacteroidales bacterium]|nr:trypsin-like peptidase domain-containing protein [Bacteroidales bacterium]